MTLLTAKLQRELAGVYDSPDRHYHNLTHVKALLALLEQHRHLFADPKAVEAAIWFHDCIYDTRAKDNEHKSAELAVACLTDHVQPQRLSLIRSLIEATATHTMPYFQDSQARDDTALFLDMDLSILGAGDTEFDAYETGVRLEYAWANDEVWCKGRRDVLVGFLEKPRIYHSQVFSDLEEDKARGNMMRTLKALGTRGGQKV